MRDFDTFIQERRLKGHSFKMFGTEYYLPPTIPYDAILRFRALGKRNATDTVSDEETFDLFAALVGQSTVDSLRLHAEFDVELMTELMNYVLQIYGVTKSEATTGSPKVKKAAQSN